MDRLRLRNTVRNFAGAGLLGLSLVAGGCVAYGTYPPVHGEVPFNVANSAAADELIMAALDWVIKRYPPPAELSGEDTGYALNLPPTMRLERAKKVVDKIGFPAQDLTPDTLHLPRYSIGRIYVRADKAEVDVYRPAFEVSSNGMEPSYQMITVRLSGGMHKWRVESTRPWAVGAFEAPVPTLRTETTATSEGYDHTESPDGTSSEGEPPVGLE